MNHVWILTAVLAALVALGWIERRLHRRRLARIPIRIHVNGTRGKSSVTRLIAGGLRAGGIVTCAKTTGTLARLILPGGQQRPIARGAARMFWNRLAWCERRRRWRPKRWSSNAWP